MGLVSFEKEKSRIKDFRRWEVWSANGMYVEFGTTGPMGGDWGHGSRTYLRLKNLGGTGWIIRVKDMDGNVYETEFPEEVEILLGGDSELVVFRDVLGLVVGELIKVKVPNYGTVVEER